MLICNFRSGFDINTSKFVIPRLWSAPYVDSTSLLTCLACSESKAAFRNGMSARGRLYLFKAVTMPTFVLMVWTWLCLDIPWLNSAQYRNFAKEQICLVIWQCQLTSLSSLKYNLHCIITYSVCTQFFFFFAISEGIWHQYIKICNCRIMFHNVCGESFHF